MYIHTFEECSSKMSLLTFSHRILVQRKDYSSQAKDVDFHIASRYSEEMSSKSEVVRNNKTFKYKIFHYFLGTSWTYSTK